MLETAIVAARYGHSVYNETKYGATRYPIDPVFLEGSGKWVNITFKDSATDNGTYTIRGYDLQYTPSGRI